MCVYMQSSGFYNLKQNRFSATFLRVQKNELVKKSRNLVLLKLHIIYKMCVMDIYYKLKNIVSEKPEHKMKEITKQKKAKHKIVR